MNCTSVGTSVSPTRNCTFFRRNYHILTLAVLMRHTRTSATPMKVLIHCCRRNNYRLCWDEEYEYLYLVVFLQAGQGEATSTAASALLSRLDKKRKKCWYEAVNSIDFTHSGRLACNTTNFTVRSTHQHCSCLISANSIALQLVQNGIYKTKDRESARVVMQKESERWKVPTPSGKCIFVDFSPEEFASAIQLRKFDIASGPDRVNDPCRCCVEVLFKQVKVFLRAPV